MPAEELDERGFFETSPGRVVFNQSLPPTLRFMNRSVSKKDLSALLDDTYDQVGQNAMVDMLDAIKVLGYRWSTRSGISLGIGEPDFVTPWHIREAAISSIERGATHYTSNLGLADLRKAICRYVARSYPGLSYDWRTETLVTVGEKTVVCELRDTMPAKANVKNGAGIDLNPAAAKALGLKPPFKVRATWHFV